jgi:membrane fusion protein, multidrug efflux system
LAEGTKGSVEAGLRTLFEVGTVVGRSDGELLDLFLTASGPAAELAFAALVEWHGPMVWRVCRDVLRESNDADDAFQATFLILARRAGAIRKRSSLGPWLYGVALRVSRSARNRAARRRNRELIAAGPEREESMADVDRLDAAPILHEEVGRLPEKYRAPLVLCYFQGLTHDQAASQLGWPVGTVRSRLAEARDRLRPRLLRRGAAPSVAILMATGRADAVTAVPAALSSATVGIAVRAGAAGTVPAAVAALVGTTLREMNTMKTSMIATSLVTVALVIAAGVGYVAARPQDPQKPVTPRQIDQAPKDDAVASKITVAAVQSKAVTIAQQYVCRIHSRRYIEVRTLEEGHITAIPVEEGQAVKKGDVLFEIDTTLYKARLDVDVAERDLAQLELNNTKRLAEKQGVSRDEVKFFEAKLAKAQAKVDLSSAELNFTKVRAPFDGMVGRPLQQVGGLVLTGENLASLSDNGSIWVYFDMPERSYLEYVADRTQKKKDSTIDLRLADGSKFSQAGKIGAIEPKVNNETGNISFRADFPNPDGLLHHGQSGTIVMNRVLENAIVIPHRATVEDHSKRFVYVVDNDNVAHKREINIRNELDDVFVVEKGVAVGDKIVTDGVRKVHDGDKVKD